MPTISFSLKDLQNLVGRKLTTEDISRLAEYGKGSLENKNGDKNGDEVSIEFGDTNLPYLWSVEGVARLFKGILGVQKGIPKLEIKRGNYKVIADKSVLGVRPCIAAFVAKGCKVDDYLLKQIVQLQEKLCESYGRRRVKVAIGVYSYDKIKFPVYYKATEPESVKFIPLDFKKEMSQQEILEEHPKGREYGWILEGYKRYPILVDSADKVLSFPPIINSDFTGKVKEGEEHLFVEFTGTEMEPLLLATNIIAYALYERGFEIYSVDIIQGNKTITTPLLFRDEIKITNKEIKSLLGLELKNTEIRKLLEGAQYNVVSNVVSTSGNVNNTTNTSGNINNTANTSGNINNTANTSGNINRADNSPITTITIRVPPYRKDILHPCDVIEDIGIMYGYGNIKEQPLKLYTAGETSPMVEFINKVRELLTGLGFQEVFSPMLTNKSVLYDKMDTQDFGTVELSNFMSETYSAVRTWLLPILINFLSKNRHSEYPQKVFEQGLVTVRKGDGTARKGNEINDYERLAVLSANEKADYTEIRQVFDYLMRMLNIDEYKIEDVEHSSFIEGRVGRVAVKGKKVAYIGEISPKVISDNGIEVPVVGLELNLSELFNCLSLKNP